MSALARARRFALVLVASVHTPGILAASHPPTLGDLRDHDSIADLVDLVLMVHRSGHGEASVDVVKHRYGPTAEIPVGFLDHYRIFVDMDL